MGTMVLIKTDGTEVKFDTKKLDIGRCYELIGCSLVERIKVRYAGRVRDCYLDEEGLYRQSEWNPKVKELAEAYYGQPCQNFRGPAVIWVP